MLARLKSAFGGGTSAKAKKGAPRQPDMHFAVEGFMHIMVLRRGKAGLDLREFAVGNARLFMEEDGCTHEQALAAHWGGLCAIYADEALFECGLEAYDDALQGLPTSAKTVPPGEQTKVRLRAASALQVTLHLQQFPADFDDFLRHIGH